jgi:hypothetical protein
MSENTLAIPPEKVELMLPTLSAHHFDVPDRMRSGHLGDEFAEQVRFSPRPIQQLRSRKHDLIEHRSLHAKDEVPCALVRLGKIRSGNDFQLLGRGIRFSEPNHIGLLMIPFRDPRIGRAEAPDIELGQAWWAAPLIWVNLGGSNRNRLPL